MSENARVKKLKRVVQAAVYARYSSEMQSPTSAKDQIDRAYHFIEKGNLPTQLYTDCDIRINQEWVQKDEAVTGKVAGRFGYQKILNGIRQKTFDILIVDDLSRLTRSLGNLLELYQLLRHHDVELVSMSDRLSSADPNSKTFFTVKGMVADFGNDAHSERTKRGLEARARGFFSTGHKPYGYDSTPTQTLQRKGREVPSHFKIEINPTKADVVRKIFTLYAQGFGKCYIAKRLNEEKTPPPKPTSLGWRTGPLDNILRNEKYIGKWVFNKAQYSYDPDTGRRVKKQKSRAEWIAHQREDLRIVPQETWEKVHKRLEENQQMRRVKAPTKEQQIFGKRNRVDNLGLLTGVITCSECGSICALVTGTHGGYYGCIEAHRHGTCKNKFLLRKSKAEQAVVEYIKEKLALDPRAIKHVTERYNQLVRNHLKKNPSRKKEVEAELGQLGKEIANLIHFITSGNTADVESISKALRERESRKEKLEQELAGMEYTDNRNLLVTPYLIRERLVALVDKITEKSDRYNGTLKTMLEKPLVLEKNEEFFKLSGRLDVGLALTQGSRQCLCTYRHIVYTLYR